MVAMLDNITLEKVQAVVQKVFSRPSFTTLLTLPNTTKDLCLPDNGQVDYNLWRRDFREDLIGRMAAQKKALQTSKENV